MLASAGTQLVMDYMVQPCVVNVTVLNPYENALSIGCWHIATCLYSVINQLVCPVEE